MGRRLWSALSFGVALLACWQLLGAGCNLFEPRDPEVPSQSSDSFIPPTDPDAVIENLQNAVAQKNSVNYVRCFADPSRTVRPFQFFPSPDAGARYASVFAFWTVDQEKTYFQNLVGVGVGEHVHHAGCIVVRR